MTNDPTFIRKRAPTLYAIIAFKLTKGLLFMLLALGVYSLADQNLPEEFRNLLGFFHLDPERKFFTDLAEKIESISEAKMVWLAGGTFLYSLFSLIEGIGLIFRVSWAGWLVIGEAVFFIPIELHELMKKFSGAVLIILGLNVLIVWYLFQNRHRLFRHHH